MRVAILRTSIALIVVTLLTVRASAALAVTINEEPPRDYVVSYCIKNGPPGISQSEGEDLLQDAIGNWEEAPGQQTLPGLSLTFVSDCDDGAQVKVTAEETPDPEDD